MLSSGNRLQPGTASPSASVSSLDEKVAEARGGSQPVGGPKNDNPFGVDLVIPFSVALTGRDRQAEQRDAQAEYSRLIAALQSEPGLRIASHPGRGGKGNEEIWVFVGASDTKVAELIDRERWVLRGE